MSEEIEVVHPNEAIVNENTPLLVPPIDDDEEKHIKPNGVSNSGDTSPAQAPRQELPFRRLVLIIASLWVGVFLSALDQTLITTILTPISNSFSSFEHISWVATAYLIATAAVQPLVGKLTDIFGRKSGLITSNVVFGLGTVLCGLATSTSDVVIGRIIAGIGGGGLTTIAVVTVSDIIPLRDRGVIQGVANIIFGIGSGLGGIFGGFINDNIGWRWAFLIQIPLIVVSGLAIYNFIDSPSNSISRAQLRRVDYLGSLTLIAFLVFLLIALNCGGNIVPWSHPLILVTLPLSFVFLILFYIVEDKIAREPIIPLSLLWNRSVLGGCLVNFFTVMSVYSILFYLPMHTILQSNSSNTTNAGLQLTPFSLGIPLGSLGSGVIMRKTGKYFSLMMLILVISTITSGIFITYPSTSPYHIRLPTILTVTNLFLFGATYGGILTTTLISLVSSVKHSDQAIITSASYLSRSTGSVIGVTVSSAIFQNTLKHSLFTRLGSKGPEAIKVIELVRKKFEDVFDETKVPREWRGEVVDGFEDALGGVFAVVFAWSVMGMLVGMMVREYHLHRTLDRTE